LHVAYFIEYLPHKRAGFEANFYKVIAVKEGFGKSGSLEPFAIFDIKEVVDLKPPVACAAIKAVQFEMKREKRVGKEFK